MAHNAASSPGGLKCYLPILTWLPQYQRGWLIVDLVAAVTVLTLLVPEGMAYAQMAGLPPETAFYTAPAALVGYALFTTSRQVITTTTSTIAVMVAAVLGGGWPSPGRTSTWPCRLAWRFSSACSSF